MAVLTRPEINIDGVVWSTPASTTTSHRTPQISPTAEVRMRFGGASHVGRQGSRYAGDDQLMRRRMEQRETGVLPDLSPDRAVDRVQEGGGSPVRNAFLNVVHDIAEGQAARRVGEAE